MTENLTAQQWQARILATRARIMEGRKRVWPEGKVRACPECGAKALAGRSDLTREIDGDGAVLVFANLHGARCGACATEFLEGYEQVALEERAGTTFRMGVADMRRLITDLGHEPRQRDNWYRAVTARSA